MEVKIRKTWTEREGANTFPKHDSVKILGIHHGTSTSYSTYTADVTTDISGKVSGGGTRTRSHKSNHVGISAENNSNSPMSVYLELKDVDANGFTKGKFPLRLDLDPKEKKVAWSLLTGNLADHPEELTLVEISIGERHGDKIDWENGTQIIHGKTLHDAFKTEQERAFDEERRAANALYAEERARQKALRAPIIRRRLKIAAVSIVALMSILPIAYLASKPFYWAAINEPGKIESSSGFSCWLYSYGYDRTVRIGGATAGNLLLRDVNVTLPQPNKWNLDFFVFKEGSLAIGSDLSYAPAEAPGGGFRYFLDIAPEDSSAFFILPRPPNCWR